MCVCVCVCVRVRVRVRVRACAGLPVHIQTHEIRAHQVAKLQKQLAGKGAEHTHATARCVALDQAVRALGSLLLEQVGEWLAGLRTSGRHIPCCLLPVASAYT